MLQDITHAEAIAPHQLRLRFEDGVEGTVDLAQLIEFRVFEPFQDPLFFAQVQVNPEIGTVVWPNQADLGPDVLYAIVAQQPIRLPA